MKWADRFAQWPAAAVVCVGALAAILARPAAAELPKLELIQGGFRKADAPTWLPGEKCLVFTDLEQAKLFRLDLPESFTVVREEASRGKAGPDGRFYGVLGGRIAAWRPGSEPEVILEKAAADRAISLNDIAVGKNGFLYFTTLKDPDKGRLSVVDINKKTLAVAFDGAEEVTLGNPNGVALAPAGDFLYVGISNYSYRKYSGVYRFPVRGDGSLDVTAGKAEKWAAVTAPDGIAVASDGDVYFTAGAVVHVFSPDARPLGTIKIPGDSGTNLTFGGEDGRTLFVTTNKALYIGR